MEKYDKLNADERLGEICSMLVDVDIFLCRCETMTRDLLNKVDVLGDTETRLDIISDSLYELRKLHDNVKYVADVNKEW